MKIDYKTVSGTQLYFMVLCENDEYIRDINKFKLCLAKIKCLNLSIVNSDDEVKQTGRYIFPERGQPLFFELTRYRPLSLIRGEFRYASIIEEFNDIYESFIAKWLIEPTDYTATHVIPVLRYPPIQFSNSTGLIINKYVTLNLNVENHFVYQNMKIKSIMNNYQEYCKTVKPGSIGFYIVQPKRLEHTRGITKSIDKKTVRMLLHTYSSFKKEVKALEMKLKREFESKVKITDKIKWNKKWKSIYKSIREYHSIYTDYNQTNLNKDCRKIIHLLNNPKEIIRAFECEYPKMNTCFGDCNPLVALKLLEDERI